MQKKQSKSMWVKGICAISIITSTSFTTFEETSFLTHTAQADNLATYDAQQGCSVIDSADSDSSEPSLSSKDTNINIKKYKETFEKNAKGGALEGKSDELVKLADKHKVPLLLMVAIIASESGWGTSENAIIQKNPFSLVGAGDIFSDHAQFETVEKGLEAGAKNLYDLYIKEGLDTPKKIGPKYAPTEGATNDPKGMNNNWISTVEAIMKELGAEGGDFKSKSGDKKSSDSEGASAIDSTNDSVISDPCSKEEPSKSGGESSVEGKSVKPNGKTGKMIEGNWTYEELPSKYKKLIKTPKFNPSFLNKPGNNFTLTGNTGQCTEFTWAFMNQLHGDGQPTDDGTTTNGERVYQAYEKLGAKTTNNPTVGYGFSAKPPYANAMIPGVGHTGVVVGVMDDGKFLIAQYNVNPDPAPSRTIIYSLIDGVPKDAGEDLIFFSGIKNSKK